MGEFHRVKGVEVIMNVVSREETGGQNAGDYSSRDQAGEIEGILRERKTVGE